jgi:hypothetical protein
MHVKQYEKMAKSPYVCKCFGKFGEEFNLPPDVHGAD